MLITGLIAAALLYGVLYWIYFQAQAQNAGAMTTMATIEKMLTIGEPNIFFFLRWLILLTLFYVVADALLAPAKRKLRNRRQRRAEDEYNKTAFRGVKPIEPPPSQDDDLAPHY
jgi:hypothetical protein